MEQISAQAKTAGTQFAGPREIRVAAALLFFKSDTVERGQIRALLPKGRTHPKGGGKSYNTTSKNFLGAAKALSDQGLIKRHPETFQVLDREALHQLVIQNLRDDTVGEVKRVLKQWRRLYPQDAHQPVVEELAELVKSCDKGRPS
ncbi:MAG TPA: hypothetical protein VFO38_06290 [Candidatus Saccharimonadales bacterium]|nr:hypothetical protein [Candidatus Saccharimonadales bacterium]